MALSSSVRSSHWVAAVWLAAGRSAITNRASEHMRSARIGFRLYAIADEPICSASNGSSSSRSWARAASRCRSDARSRRARPGSQSTWASTLRE